MINVSKWKAYFHLRNIRTLKPFPSHESLVTVTHAFITSRIDYCNSLLFGISDYNINRLQRIQNCAAQVITNTKKYDHITPVLRNLHWLPVRYRIKYKILLIVYKVISGTAPSYLCDLLSIKTSTRTLRSNNHVMLHVPVSRLKTFGDASFSTAGPILWNGLPLHVKTAHTVGQFKSLLKTQLFTAAFESS